VRKAQEYICRKFTYYEKLVYRPLSSSLNITRLRLLERCMIFSLDVSDADARNVSDEVSSIIPNI
jgi:hypothetical protein